MSLALQLPPALYGTAKDVQRRLASGVKAFSAGASWDEAFGGGQPVAVPPAPGLIVLNGPAPLLAGEPHFHAFLPLSLLLEGKRKGKVPESRVEEAVAASLETAWGLLGVLSNPNQLVVIPPARHRAIAASALAHWPELEAAGPRYSAGLREGKHFWEVPNSLGYVLGQLGVPAERLNKRLSGTELRAILSSLPLS